MQARALRSQAFALLSPKVIANGSYTINDKEITLDFTESIPDEYKELLGLESDPITLQQKTAWGADATVSQPLFDASSLPLLRGAFHNLDSAQSSVESARQQVRAGAAKSHYGLAVARGWSSSRPAPSTPPAATRRWWTSRWTWASRPSAPGCRQSWRWRAPSGITPAPWRAW
ncbi:MAG: hypothetical protein IPK67_19315 [Planctomycetes bacterium]|nr:hypothetical protein [Planctomycetota bacterium]